MQEKQKLFFLGISSRTKDFLYRWAEQKGLSFVSKEEEASFCFMEVFEIDTALELLSQKGHMRGIKILCVPEDSYPSFVENKKQKKYEVVLKAPLTYEVLEFLFILLMLPKYSDKAEIEAPFSEYKWSLIEKYYVLQDLKGAFLENKKKESLQALQKGIQEIGESASPHGFSKTGELCKKIGQELEKGLSEIENKDWEKELSSCFSSLITSFKEVSLPLPKQEESKPPESKPPESKPPESKPPESKPPESKPPESKPPESKPPESKPPESKPPESKPPESKPPESKPPESKPPESKPPESKPPESKPPESKPPESKPEEKQGLGVYFIDDDEDFTKLVSLAASEKKISIEIQNSFAEAQKKLQDPNFKPKIILFDISSEKESISGLDLVQRYVEAHPQRGDTILGILSAKGEISFRSEAVNKSIDLYLQKPISIEGLLSQLELMLSSKEEIGGNLLLADDDLDFGKFFALAFENTIWKVKTITSAKNIFEELEVFRPDLLFLDIEMPEVDGIQVLKMIRSDARYASLSIFIVTAKQDPEYLQSLSKLEIEGLLLKPIDPKALVVQVRQFFQKREALNVIYRKDPFLGIYQRRALESFLRTLMVQRKSFGLVVFLSEVLPGKEQEKGRWNHFATSLNAFFPQKDLAAIWEENKLVLIFSTFPKKLLHRLIHNFFHFLEKEEAFKGLFEAFKLFASIVFYPEEGNSVRELFEKAEKYIQEKKKDLKWGVFGEENFAEKIKQERKVLLVASDEEIRTVMQFYLQREGFTLIEIATGKEGLSWIDDKMLQEKVDLVILDMDLEDISGILLLEKMSIFLGEKTPLILLSYHNRDKEVLDIFSLRNIIYMEKPFSLEAFSRRLEQTL